MKYEDERIFTGGINTDDDTRVVPNGDVRGLWYCRLGDVDGHGFCVTTSKGTSLVNNSSIQTSDRIIGATEWIESYSVLYMVWDSGGIHQIWKYDIALETHTLVAASSEFNFQKDKLISHAFVLDGMLFWCDDYWNSAMYNNGTRLFNPPYHIDIQKAIDGDYTTFDFQAINFVKFPPAFGPSCVYGTDQTRADNKLRKGLFRFRYQYIYWNNEQSAWSPYSNLPLPTIAGFVSGTNWADSSVDNYIDITIDTGHFSTRKINVCVSKNESAFGVFIEIDKDALGLLDNVPYTFPYYGNTSDKPLPLALKNYDRVPIHASCMEKIPENRAAFINYVEGYDKIDIDMTAEAIYHETPIGSVDQFLDIIAVDFFNTSFSTWFSPTLFFRFSTGQVVSISGRILGSTYINYNVVISEEMMIEAMSQPTTFLQNETMCFLIAQAFADFFNADFSGIFTTTAIIGGAGSALSTLQTSITLPVLDSISFGLSILLQTDSLSTPTLKTGAHHKFFIQYYDEANRDGTALTSEAIELYVPFPSEADAFTARASFSDPNNPYRVNPKFTINQIPPIWATHWQILEAKTTEISNFQQVVITNVVPIGNRWYMDIQSKYQIENIGATINHQISVGDLLRFSKQGYANVATPGQSGYIEKYFELEILEYLPTGGFFGNQRIAVEKFNLSLLGTNNPLSRGQLVEIYTPQPILNDDGGLFVSAPREICVQGTIANPHTDDRYHTSPDTITGTCIYAVDASDAVIVQGDKRGAVGGVFWIGTSYTGLVILTESYDSSLDETTYVLSSTISGTPLLPDSFKASFDQIVTSGVSTLPATISSDWGDVWLRYRNMNSGYTNNISTDPLFYWMVEDPHYSDYWSSKINGMGRIAAVVPTAKQTHKIASAIHGGNFIDNSQINDFCSFELIFGKDGIVNVQDMDEQYGPVYRAVLDGKTLKCIQQRKENSIYIKAAGYSISGDGTEAPVALSNIVFTQWRPSQSVHGTSWPDSVVVSPLNNIMYFDSVSGCFVESFENGPMNISDGEYKFGKKSQELSNLVNTYPSQITSYIDEENGEVGWGFRFETALNVYDYHIVVFDYSRRRWRTYYDYNHLRFVNLGNKLFGFAESNQIYKHNQISDSFHDESANEKISIVSNSNPVLIKRLSTVGLKTNKRNWSMPNCFTDGNGTYPTQETSLSYDEFSVKEGNVWAQVKRDMNTPNFDTTSKARLNGNVMRGQSFTIDFERPIDTVVNGQTVTFTIKTTGILSETII